MTRPLLLDLFCGAGGAAVGYYRAGFDVVGVDNRPMPRYPFKFIRADALEYMNTGLDDEYAAIHASPPCKRHTLMNRCQPGLGDTHPELIAPTRDLLEVCGLPWIIENVPGAPLRPDYKLCGCMFGLPALRRERWFETSWSGFDLRSPCSHSEKAAIQVAGHGTHGREYRAGNVYSQADRERAMGIDWMNRDELAQAIPPAYTEYLGAVLLAVVGVDA